MRQGIKNIYHLINAFLANLWFGFPSRRLTVIGVTGTDGKTTTVSLIYHILHNAGYNVSMISSVGAVIGGKTYDVGFHVTTPSSWALQRFISLCHPVILNSFQDLGSNEILKQVQNDKKQVRHDKKKHFLVLETTSHALDQHRVWGIRFDVGVLTNVSHEHLDYHKSYDNYAMTKMKLLEKSKVAVVNKDDGSYKLLKSKVTRPPASSLAGEVGRESQSSKSQLKTQSLVTYGLKSNADVNPKVFPFKTRLIGDFNKYNVLAAIAVARKLDIGDSDIKKAIESFEPPIGRGQIVYKNDFSVMVDFAHTPNAFEQILSSIKPSIKGKLIHVFGSAGLRDASKRPLMGRASAKYADFVVLTAEDPRTESVEKIIEEISKGIFNFQFSIFNEKSKVNFQLNKKYLFKIPDRREAIGAAIEMAGKEDFVLITGKAHEQSMNYGKGEEPWDEFGVVKKALSEKRPRRSRASDLRGRREQYV